LRAERKYDFQYGGNSPSKRSSPLPLGPEEPLDHLTKKTEDLMGLRGGL